MAEKHSGNDWWMDTEEFAGLMSEMEAQATLPEADAERALPTIQDERKAEAHLRAMQYWQGQMDGIENHAAAEMDRIGSWRDTEIGKLERKQAWHTRGLKAFCWQAGAKTIKLIAGTLKRIKGRDHIEIADEAAFVANPANAGLVRTKIIKEPDKKIIMATVKATGEIPDGVDIVTSEDAFKVVLRGQPETEE